MRKSGAGADTVVANDIVPGCPNADGFVYSNGTYTTLDYIVAPEPASVALFCLGAVGLLLGRRR